MRQSDRRSSATAVLPAACQQPGDAIRETPLVSRLPTIAATVVSVVGSLLITAAPVDATELTTITDDTNTFSIGLPTTWQYIATDAGSFEDSGVFPMINAGPTIDHWAGNLGGLMFLGRPTDGDAASGVAPEIAAALLPDNCTAVRTPSPESSIAALPTNLFGTWQCGGVMYSGLVGSTADGNYVVNAFFFADDPNLALEVLSTIRYLAAGDSTTGGPVAPPTTAPHPTADLEVTNPGDQSTTYSIRPSRESGLRSRISLRESKHWETVTTYVGESTPFSDEDHTRNLELRASMETVATGPLDPSFHVVITPRTYDGTYIVTSPGSTSEATFGRQLVGQPFELHWGDGGTAIGPFPPDDSHFTDRQIDELLVLTFPDVSLPATPIGVGATWTAPVQHGDALAAGTHRATYRLDAVDGDRFTVSARLTLDLTDAIGVQSIDGSVTVTVTIVGKRSTPNWLTVTTDQTVTYHAVAATILGDQYEEWYESTTTRTYVERPADQPAG